MPQTREHQPEDLTQPVPTTFITSDASLDGHPASASCPPQAHPLAHLAGKYNEEPLWDDFLQAMQEVRCQMNAQEETAE